VRMIFEGLAGMSPDAFLTLILNCWDSVF
jgi:hypothetical protein